MTYKIYGNIYDSDDSIYNADVPTGSEDITAFDGDLVSGKDGYELYVDGTRFNDYLSGVDGTTLTNVQGSTFGFPAGEDITVELKYDKDDKDDNATYADPDTQDIDVVSMDLSEFDDEITLAVKSAQNADRLYLSNVTSFTVGGSTYTKDDVDGSGNTGDQNDEIFGDGTYEVFEDKSQSALVTYIGADGLEHTVTITISGGGATGMEVMVDFICFARGTRIETKDGSKAIEELRSGDFVKTKDNGFQPIRWIASRKLTKADLILMPHLRPIRIRQNSLAKNVPDRDLVVSPQHRMLLDDWRCQMLFGEREMLAPAKSLLNDKTITVDHEAGEVEYFHFMCDSHQIVYANGAESESFHPGEFGLTALDAAVREELYVIFPHLDRNLNNFGELIRPALRVFEAEILMQLNGL